MMLEIAPYRPFFCTDMDKWSPFGTASSVLDILV